MAGTGKWRSTEPENIGFAAGHTVIASEARRSILLPINVPLFG
jgi:hypothetical protein